MLNPSTAGPLALSKAIAPTQAAAEYWKTTLSDAPELLELPTDHARPARRDPAGARVGVELDEALSAGLEALSRRHGATPYMTLLAGWAVVLSRLSGQADVVIGALAGGRGRREADGLTGFAADALAIRVDLSGAPTVAELLRRVRERALEAQRHQDLPLEQVVELVRPARSLAHTPLFQVMLAWQETPGGERELTGMAGTPLDGVEAGGAPFDLTLSLAPRGGRIAGTLAYATALFDRATVERHARYLRRVLEAMAADESQAVDRLPLLPETERRLVVEAWNDTDCVYPRGACVHELFAAQAARTPEAVALSWRGERLTYAQLDARANRLANALRRRGVGPEVRVGICLPRTPELVAAMLGVLKAGGAYVPLDPAYPRERLGYMLEDAGVSLVITESSLADRLPENAPALLLDRERGAVAAESGAAPESGAGPENLSHVIFTSGSTGRPKGVMIRHASVGVLLHWLRENVTDEERSSVLFSTSINFDVSVAEVFGTLAWGGTLVIAENALELATLGEKVVYASMVPSAAAELLKSGGIPACVKTLNLGGEALPNALAQGLYALGTVEKVGNLYGPTEDTTYSTYHLVPRGADRVLVGTPVANTQAYVLDAHLQPVPVGAVGELYLAGDGLSRGYANRPAMTAERFVPCPFGAPGARMYRVMDRVRWREGAEVRARASTGVDSVPADARTDARTHGRTAVLEYLGRTDFQVKVRGYRIELGEIEARLAEHPGVRAPVVLAREDAPGDRRLVAYYLADAPVAVGALTSHLADRLPAYMVPAAYVWVEAYPLTPNGKVDRRALPAPGGDAYAAREYEAPMGETEQAVAAIWTQVLGAERVGRRDNFFELGGHSLMAVRVLSRVGQALGVEALPGDLFERPVLADFARGLETAGRAGATAIERVDRTGSVPLSFAQQRLWFLEQLGSTGAAYHIPMSLRLQGELNRGALVHALDRIVARHEALRTTFPAVDGEPVQHIAPAGESGLRLVEHDLHARPDAEDALRRLVPDEAGAPFDLARGPLIRGRLVRMAADDHVLLLTMHHIVSDGWSIGVLYHELGALYTAFARGEPDPLPPLPVQYADYAVWHRRWVEGEVLRRQADYWRETLSGAPQLLELPTDHPRPAKQDFAGASVNVELDESLTAALKTLGQRHGATLHMTLVAGWAAVLARLSGQDEVVVGTPSASRGRAEVEELIGFFVNTLALRVDLSGSPSVAELLGRVKERSLGAQHHQDIPFEQVVELVQPVRSRAHTPLFQAMFAWQNAPGSRLELPGLALGPLDPSDPGNSSSQAAAMFDLSLALWEEGGRIEGVVEYATALFERETVERWAGYLRRVLTGMVADERGSVERLELLSSAERRRVVEEWNATDAAFPAGACVHELFAAQAARAPNAVAVAWEDETLSYAALDRAANRLANHLRRRGVRPETRVGICLDRGTELVVAVLAVLKAGGAYVPLDPAYPAERLAFMLADSGAPLLLTRLPLPEGLPPHAAGVVCLEADREPIEAESAQAPAAGVLPENLAYVIYTSGSTGTPKGVMVAHRGVPNLAYAQDRRFGIDGTSRVLQFASFSFDAAVAELFAALLAGATLVMAPREKLLPGGGLLETLRRGRVTVATLPPSVLAVLPPDGLPELRTVVSAGESVDAATVQRWSGGRAFVNAYGPTEVTVCATSARCEADGRVPAIGSPLENVRVYVLNAAGRPAPVGVPGELYVGGVGVARGYLGRPGLTADKFVPDPFGGDTGARLYRTGDRVRWSARGELEFLGRVDEQVKVRGFRIEPGEIEARLAEHPGVREAVVLVREDAPGDRRLVAYVAGDENVGAEMLRAHLSERLPEYMVPAAFVRLAALPLNPNGKTDRKALPAPEGDAFAARGYEAPSGRVEAAVAAIWAELLGAERVGRRDHFFELGGHSLLGVRVVSRVRQALGVESLPGDLFERPVLADFARGLETAARAEAAAIQRVDRTGNVPLSFAQQRLWFLEQLGGMGAAYHIPMSLRLRGDLDRDALVRALDRIVARHEVLRTTFPTVDGEPVQHIAPVEESAFGLVEHDLHAAPDAEADLRRLMRDEASAPLDLARGPLVRGRLVRMAADDHALLLTMHHIVSDGWSTGVLFRELGALYAAFARGEPDPLPPLPVQYADYATWHRRGVEGPVLEAQAEYWSRTLVGAPELLELPTDHPRPAKQDFAGASVEVELDEALTAALKALGQRHGTTLFMTLLAGWANVLARLSGQDCVVIGTPSANRGHAEVEELIGFFVNTLPLRVDLSDGPGVGELLQRVKTHALEAQRNQDIPFEQVVEQVRPVRSLAYSPLFQVMFAWQNEPDGTLELPGLAVGRAGASERDTAKFDLTLTLWEDGGRIAGSVEYATALFERATVERFTEYLRRVLAGMAQDDAVPVDGIPLLPEAERATVVEAWNATAAPFPAGACIHELFEAQVERTPGAEAVAFERERLTYAELNARANRLAHHLRALGVGPDARVGICMERGPGMVVGMLAVLKAGGAYLPLDPAYPAERLRHMLADGAPAALLTEPALRPLFADATLPVVEFGAPGAAAWDERPASNPGRGALTPDHLAYVIYTSGSTGRPKGVMVEHRSLVNHTAWQAAAFGIGARDTVLQRTSISFDASVWELWTPLATGARMLLLSSAAARDPEAIGRAIEEGGVTVAQFVPTLLQAVLGALPAGSRLPCRTLFCGGEPLSAALVEEARAAGAGEVVNLYGPTEATIDSTWHPCPRGDGRAPSIGRPIANARIYVLDARAAPVPVGVAGELYVGGAGVARGYLGRAGLTAERFVPDSFAGEPGARLYRTGDRARWLADGSVEFLGRTDHQVKVRGFRIEPGEIEAGLRSHPGVREAVVLARADAPGDTRLVAYLAGDADAKALRAWLSERLPEHMLPAAFVRLDALPLTPNGKLDRKALPAPEGDAFATSGYEAPSGRAEAAVAAIWAELLGAERVGRGDHFFERGGHSLLAVRVVSRVRQALGVDVAPRDLFERPVLADFARGLQTAARAEGAAIERVDRAGKIPLSFAQQRLWFLEQLGNLGGTYHVPMGTRLRGDLDGEALRRALDRLVARHEALRTTFPLVDGEPVQRIAPAGESGFRLVEHDLRAGPGAEDALRRLVRDEAGAPFDLAQGPLFRGRLVRMADDDHVLLLTMHHIVSDGWSTGVLFREMGTLYAAFVRGDADPLPPLPVQYADYAAWHRRRVEGPVLEAQAEYWTRTLAGAPELLELPADRPRPPRRDFAGASLPVELDEALTAALRTLSQRHGTTLFMTLLAGWAAVLARLSGQDDVVIGTPSANRGQPEVEELIGFFVNILPVRVELGGSPTVAGLLGQVRARALEAQQNQDIPFEQVVELLQPARSLAYSPLFQVLFTWQNGPDERLELPGLQPGAVPEPARESAKFDLTLTLAESGDRIVGELNYATALFDRATAERFIGYLRRVLEEMAADGGRRMDRLTLMPDGERARVLGEWNRTEAAYPAGSTLHALFEAQVERTPDAVAVSFEGRSLTYAGLNARANQLAHFLAERGVGPDVRVGLSVERSLEMMVGLLAVLKAGGAYVALDPSYPEDRLRYMLADSAPAVVLTQGALAGRFDGAGIPVVALDAHARAWADGDDSNPERAGLTPDHLAYVIYTSGSTGLPKGVMVAHRSVVNVLTWMQGAFGLSERDVVLQKTPYSFDASLRELIPPLLVGARMVVARPGGHRDAAYLLETVRAERVTTLHFVPSMLQVLVEEADFPRCTSLERVVCGGEALPRALVERFHAAAPGARLYNVYGPTEAAVDVTAWSCAAERGREGSIPIGAPMANTRLYVLDRAGEPVPVGVAGELYIGGVQVARGYLNRAALTADRFVPDRFGGEAGGRLYRTGDLARWRPDGAVEFLGRGDAQVKVRGYRIELGEIEAGLRSHPAVREAVVLAREDAPGEKRLVAYLAGDADPETLRAHLAERLPEYMVPAAYVRLDTLPLTPNGKVNRRALPAPDGDAFAARGYEAPTGAVEQAVAAIWAELLGMTRVGRGDHFFELGGHSLLAVRVVSRVRQALGVEASPGDVFERPVLAHFARGLGAAAQSAAMAIAPVDRDAAVPLSFAQQRLWFLEQLGGTGAAYHVPMRLRLRGELDRGALERALDRIVARHEALRTTFPAVDGEPVQRIAPVEQSALRLVEHDLRGAPDAEDALRRVVSNEAGALFDLAHGPLFRGRLVRMADDHHVLLLTMHHIVSDGWSAGVLHRELGVLYTAFARGEPDPLPPLPVQYADYAAWHRHWVDGPVLEAQAEYWTRTLAGAPELLELPADRPRQAQQDFAGALLEVELDEALTAALKTLSQRHGATLYMTLLAGWAVVLARLSGQDDVVIGTPSANRGRSEIEDLIGFFINTLPLRVDLSDRPAVGELLRRVKTRALEAQRNQDIPFEQVVERVRPTRSLAHSPLFQVMLAWQNAPGEGLELPGLTLSPADVGPHATAKFDLTLTLWEEDGRIVGALEYATALFERATVARYAGYLRRVLAGMAEDDAVRMDGIPLLPAAERARLVEEWSAGDAADPSGQCIHALFEAQAARTPDTVALVHEGERLTYAQLDARANRLAHRLASRGVERGVAVGVCLEWRPELVVALLATLKAGGVYVPLDPSLPAGRLAYIAADAGVRAVVTRTGLAERVSAGAAVWVDVEADEVSAAPGAAPRALVFPEDLAYVIYTSGSTGQPKGVAVEHGAAAAHLVSVARVHGIVPEDRVLQFASAGFDVSLEQVFFPLLSGATLVLRGAELWSAPEFRARVRTLGITVANLPPAYWQEVADGADGDALAGIRLLLIGGDALPATAADARGAGRLVNCYGPTETVVTATAFAVERGAAGGPLVPIGRPLPGRAVYVLDAGGAPVPTGVAGELYIGGPLLARGYLGRPSLTGERFVPDPFGPVPGGRLYRTGDRVRWSASGNLEFLGRTDFQVKIRGFRIELGEIEAALRSHDAVRDAVVLARADAPGDSRLVAYLVGDADAGADAGALRAHLSERLPEYMIPAAYVRLDGLPLTPNGKLDRKALPAPEGDAFATSGYEAPSGPVEQAVAAIWAELLRAERVGRGDHFFELGGHSLLAVRVASRVRQALGVEASPRDVFERPVLAEFARGLQTAARAEAAAIVPVERSGPLALSFAQQGLWLLEQLGNLGGTYHIPVRLRLRGELDRGALERALDRIVARHEALRTSFPTVDGEPVQRIAPPEASGLRLVEHDLHASPDAEDALRRLVGDEASARFDLAHGPLIRGRLIRVAADDHVLLLTMHHIVSDGWSAGVLFRELAALYAAFARGDADPLPPLPVQYADYAAWHRRWVKGPDLEAQAEYWTRTLAGAPELLELPTDHPRPAKQDFAGASVDVELDAALTAALKTLSQRHGTTLFMTLLAGWAVVLARLAGQDDVVIGTPSANRGRSETEDLIGFFINLLPLRVDLSDRPGVGELLQRVKTLALEAQRNQDIPFEQVVERVRPARSLAYSPLFQVMLAWQNASGGGMELPGLTLSPADVGPRATAKFDLLLSLWEEDGRIAGAVEYATSLFTHATVERYTGYLRRVLEAMAEDDSKPVSQLDLLSAAERRRVVEDWNATGAGYPAGACVHDLFRAQAARTGEAVALSRRGERLTYAELEARANQISNALRRRGVGPEVRVGICLPRTPELVAAMLGVLKAGGAYVPLDPAYPRERLGYMLQDAAIALVVTESALAERLPENAAALLLLDRDREAIAAESAAAPESGVLPENLSHIIFTSGSTGRPKGVMIRHASVVVLLHWLREIVTDEERSSVLFSTSINFDVSVAEVFGTLAWGGTLVIAENALELATLGEDVVYASMVPSAAEELLRSGGIPPCVKTLNLAGEALPNALAQGLYALGTVEKVGNVYGPTEDTSYSTYHLVPRGADAVLIGTPMTNTQAYVLDAHLQPVPTGVAGELYLAGGGLSRGYANRPAMTAERFVPCPFGAPGARMYRAMDRVRWKESAGVREWAGAEAGAGSADSRTEAPAHGRTAALEYLGRTDFQVKVRGYRIELGEIETRLVEHPAVHAPVVLAREDAPGDRRLVAYYLADGPVAVEALKTHLAERLPEYMVPAAYVWMEAYPLTSTGKLDRNALPAPEGDAYASQEYEAPVGETEQAVAAIWADLLGLERVGRHDHFFQLGGNSLLATRLVFRIRREMDVELPVGDVFEKPALSLLARHLAAAQLAQFDPDQLQELLALARAADGG